MKLHTTPKKVEEYLNTSCSFTTETNPSISAVNGWIQDISSELNELTEHKYSSASQVDILNYEGQKFLLTSRAPISNVTVSVNTAMFGQEPVWVELDLYINYLLDEAKGKIIINDITQRGFSDGLQKFKVEYTAGVESTPYWLRNLATRMVAKQVLSATLNNRVVNSEDASQIRIGQVSVIKPSDFGTANYDRLIQSIEDDLDSLRGMTRGVRYVNY